MNPIVREALSPLSLIVHTPYYVVDHSLSQSQTSSSKDFGTVTVTQDIQLQRVA